MAARSDWTWLYEKLSGGVDTPAEVASFVEAGGRPSDLLPAVLGDRERGAAPCLRSLESLLKARADPNMLDKRLDTPLIHVAAWSSLEAVRLLLRYRADLEAKEPGTDVPPLNTALAAGNAPVALLLLEQRADATWRHKDGATALHVATSWLSSGDVARQRRRRPPSGDEPWRLVEALLSAGADPSLPMAEGPGDGLTALGSVQRFMRTSSWLSDPEIGKEFECTAVRIVALLSAADVAMRSKLAGNKAFGEQKFAPALEAWAQGRAALLAEGLGGHHMAVLLSNEANCRKKMGDIDGCRRACEEGLKCACSAGVRSKLEFHLAACTAAAKAEAPSAEAPATTGAATTATAATVAAAGAGDVAATAPQVAEAAPRQAAKSTPLKGGFFKDPSAKPMYGPEGSPQGKNHSDLVKVPVHGTMQDVPYGKVVPITVPNPYLDAESEEDG